MERPIPNPKLNTPHIVLVPFKLNVKVFQLEVIKINLFHANVREGNEPSQHKRRDRAGQRWEQVRQ